MKAGIQMSPENIQPWWRGAISEAWQSKIVRILAFIFVAFEIYNTAVLPAIRGTQEAIISQNRIGQSKAEECSAKLKAIRDTVPTDPAGFAVIDRLVSECRSIVPNTP